ncbi:MAG: hypothetical protein GY796_15040, partial [Chloroflexi bacterium]|nr:hypothetical protein [Chloroflexota bacterium]
MNLSPLLKLFNQIPTYNALADAIHWGELSDEMRRPLGVMTAARPALLAALQADLQRPILFITARADRARILTEQIQVWARDASMVHRLPDPDALPHEKIFWGIETIQSRLAALSALATYNHQREIAQFPPLIITSARALMHHTLPLNEFAIMEFKLGQRIRLNEVVAQWVELGYQPEDVVEVAGSFSRRGGILDIFPPSSPCPIRIELFGDEIDSLRSFDPATQRSDKRLNVFIVGPATETLPRFAPGAAERLSHWNLTELQPSTKITFEEDIARLSNGTAFRGIEYYLPFFYHGRNGQSGDLSQTSVLDYLPENALIFVEDPQELASVVDELEIQAQTLKRDLVTIGDLPTEWPDPYFGWSALVSALIVRNPFVLGFTSFSPHRQAIATVLPNPPSQSPTTSQSQAEEVNNQSVYNKQGGTLDTPPDHQSSVSQSPISTPLIPYYFQSTFTAAPAFGGQVKTVLPDIIERKKRNERVVLVSRQSARLSHLFN